jgi:5-formyltetrahydrofolate cyclo-ligase
LTSSTSKAEWRARWKTVPVPTGDARVELSQALCRHIATTAPFLNARRIGLFSAQSREIDLSPLWRLAPGRCAFPRVVDPAGEMTFFGIDEWTSLTPGYRRILEPPANESLRVQDWATDDLILVPALSFDHQGNRLGSGKGFYDRFLSGPGRRAIRWGVCFDEQVSSHPLPSEPHDIRVVALATPSGIRNL